MSERDAGMTRSDGTPMSRIEALRESLVPVMDLIEEDYQTSLVEFNSSANVVHPLTEVDNVARSELKGSVRGLVAGGGTTIGGGMRLGMETIADESGEKTMILLSDGKENEPPYVDNVLPEIRNAGIKVFTIGIGADIDEQQLKYIADQTGGDVEIDPNIEELRRFYFELAEDAQNRQTLSSAEERLDQGDRIEDDCKVDSSCEDAQFSLSYEGSDMNLIVVDPNGNEIVERGDVAHREGGAHEVWSVKDPEPGQWNYEVEVIQVDAPQETLTQATADSTVDGELFVSDDLYEATGLLRIQLLVSEGFERYVGANAHAEITPPSGANDDIIELSLDDNGSGPDDITNDGIYSGYFHPTEIGEYEFKTIVEGGEYEELKREFIDHVSVSTVIDSPAKPYQSEASYFDIIQEYGPLAGALILMAGVMYTVLRWLEPTNESV